MTLRLEEFNTLVDAEDYFKFFKLPYDQQVLNVNRLHILKQFSLSIKEINKDYPNLEEQDLLNKYRAALEEAYQVLLSSSGVEQKLFAVFQKPKNNVVMLTEIQSE
ncbi:MAG: nitrogenase-stabilizing/protective protein NifW [Symploca sp. SIO3C6]|uniref:Nitrogenase-stabilizing/protective protein NifW n=1 Tax=Symploca sp. SIO1C4 TaxID=2607765 RepID=A0A6B3NA33_9CYAN|nr:nitrogenase-stabilizing/protective protein NifW [Symploca sp. SIO3C6]NER27745.1 nitrogenase-stabilizing/protective protein NifW [Symploca sp. SIO1C4]NET05828.1 nitrogenase-stabilizing/protective protein NifW [Symploca sp. SIO2B6]NET49968.1 nitrogenase-stabilizing/protective protein NifW [Merismopedia sp. SIO2A8]